MMRFIFIIFYSIILPIISLKQNKPKLCIDCKFITDSRNVIYSKCSLFPSTNSNINFLVSGIKNEDYQYCSIARSNNLMCGEEGKSFEKNIVKK